jgi:hypothetical protein
MKKEKSYVGWQNIGLGHPGSGRLFDDLLSRRCSTISQDEEHVVHLAAWKLS